MEYDNHEECQHIIYTVLQTHSKTFKYLRRRRKAKILSNPRILEWYTSIIFQEMQYIWVLCLWVMELVLPKQRRKGQSRERSGNMSHLCTTQWDPYRMKWQSKEEEKWAKRGMRSGVLVEGMVKHVRVATVGVGFTLICWGGAPIAMYWAASQGPCLTPAGVDQKAYITVCHKSQYLLQKRRNYKNQWKV